MFVRYSEDCRQNLRRTVISLVRMAMIGLIWMGSHPIQAREYGEPFDLPVLPCEHRKVTDPETGAEMTFLTTNSATDTNLYFHERSWLADESLILFYSSRENGGAMAYLTQTGELVRLTGPQGGIRSVNAAKDRNSIFGRRGAAILEWAIGVEVSPDPASVPSKVTARERVIARLDGIDAHTPPAESSDGRHLAVGVQLEGACGVYLIEEESGNCRELFRVPDPPGYGGHVQWSKGSPYLLSFAGRPHRLMVVDIREGIPRAIYRERQDEHVTHEHWWTPDENGDDRLVFCGGTIPEPVENSHVKVINVRTGKVRIIGAGSWWPGGGDEEVARRNYWHCAGSEDGRWVVADNWHGDITLFEGKTSRPRQLTVGHRHYGHGLHPHVGWDRRGEKVILTSHRLGDPNVCVVTIPEDWQKANPDR